MWRSDANLIPKNLDLLLVQPSLDFTKDLNALMARKVEQDIIISNCPPPGIGYLLAIAKKNGIKAKFIDMVTSKVHAEELYHFINISKPTLVGFGALTIQIKHAGVIAKEIKNRFPKTLVCAGGMHPTAMPKETLDEFSALDFIISGEGELALLKIFDHLDKNLSLSSIPGVATRENPEPGGEQIKDLDSLPFPAWDEMDLSLFHGIFPHRTKLELPMWTSRGCPFPCTFCARPLGRDRVNRSVASVMSEIERNIEEFGCESIAFIDETFIVNKKWSSELFKAMIKRGLNKKINWSCETHVNITSPELFELMKESGCYYVFFGLENADDSMLRDSGKMSKTATVKNAVKWAKDAGIVVAGSFIIGLPGETDETVMHSIKLAQELGLYSVTFPIAIPFPGTHLRQQALNGEHGLRLLTDDWNDYDKQYPGVMESVSMPIGRRLELQKIAYELNPKNKIEDYIKNLSMRQQTETAGCI